MMNCAKRACPACRRAKRRCLHNTEVQPEQTDFEKSDAVNNQDLDNHDLDNVTAMERDYDYKSNKSSAAKRIRKGPQDQEPSPFAGGPSSSSSASAPKRAPSQAVIAGIPTTIPPAEAPVNMYDVEEFLSHLEVIAGLAKPPRDFKKCEDKLLSILAKWNSVYTIQQNPSATAAESRGLEVGRNLANLAIFSNREGLLKHLHDYFKRLEVTAEENQRAFTAADLDEYAKDCPVSWVYMQLSQVRFAQNACVAIAETTRTAGVLERQKERQEGKNRLARLQDEFKASKIIENKGGMVFGSGGGAHGGFEFGIGGSMGFGGLQGGANRGGSKSFSGEQIGSMGFSGTQGGATMGGSKSFSGEQSGGAFAGGMTSFSGQQYGTLFGGSTNLTGQQGGGALASGSTSFAGEQDGSTLGGSTNLSGQQGGGTLAGRNDTPGGGPGTGTMRRDPFGDD